MAKSLVSCFFDSRCRYPYAMTIVGWPTIIFSLCVWHRGPHQLVYSLSYCDCLATVVDSSESMSEDQPPLPSLSFPRLWSTGAETLVILGAVNSRRHPLSCLFAASVQNRRLGYVHQSTTVLTKNDDVRRSYVDQHVDITRRQWRN